MLNNLYISSINEVLLIAEKQNDIYSKLKSSEKVSCHVCNKGYLISYNAHCDKAHSFICSNEKYIGHYHFDMLLDIK